MTIQFMSAGGTIQQFKYETDITTTNGHTQHIFNGANFTNHCVEERLLVSNLCSGNVTYTWKR